jgi:DHA2 family methylenomycin A resistance protein-like MFS transporter
VQRHDRRLVLAVVSAASFLLSFDLSGFVVAMPSIRVAFSATDSQLTWAQNSFALAGCAALPLVGVLGDRLGRSSVFCGATIVFLVSSVFCAFAGDVVALTWWRGCQGIASAAFLAIGTALLRDVWGTEMGRTVGFLTGAGAVGMSLGPVLGGVMVDLASWRTLLVVEAAAGALLAVAACTVLLGLPTTRRTGLDVVGAGAASVAIAGAVVLVHLWQPNGAGNGGDVGRSVPIVAVTLACIVIFVWRQRTSTSPALPRAVAGVGSFRVMVVVGFLAYLGLSATAFFISLVAQSVDGWSALPVGLIMLPITVGLVIGTVIGPALARRRGPCFVIVLGYTACALGTLALLGLSTNAIGWTAVALGNAVSGLGAGMASPQALAYGLRGIDNRDTAAASSWLWVSRQWGSSLGFALLAMVAFGSLTLVIGARLVMVIAAIAFVTSAVIARVRMQDLVTGR